MKRFISIIMVFVLIFLLGCTGVFAKENEKDKKDKKTDEPTVEIKNARIWQYEDHWVNGYATGNWIALTPSYPAQATGEVFVVSNTVETSSSITGTITTNTSSSIQASIGVTLGQSVSWNIQQWSRQLNKGEYVKPYWRPYYKVWN